MKFRPIGQSSESSLCPTVFVVRYDQTLSRDSDTRRQTFRHKQCGVHVSHNGRDVTPVDGAFLWISLFREARQGVLGCFHSSAGSNKKKPHTRLANYCDSTRVFDFSTYNRCSQHTIEVIILRFVWKEKIQKCEKYELPYFMTLLQTKHAPI